MKKQYVFVCGVACAAAVVILADYMHALPGASRQQTGTSTSALDASPPNLNPTHTKLQTDAVSAIDRILNSTKLQLSRAERLFVQAATEAGVGSPDTINTEGAQVLPRDIMQQLKTELKAEMKTSLLKELFIENQRLAKLHRAIIATTTTTTLPLSPPPMLQAPMHSNRQEIGPAPTVVRLCNAIFLFFVYSFKHSVLLYGLSLPFLTLLSTYSMHCICYCVPAGSTCITARSCAYRWKWHCSGGRGTTGAVSVKTAVCTFCY